VHLWLRKCLSRFAHSLKDVKTFGRLDDGSTPPNPIPHIFWPQHLLHTQIWLHSVFGARFFTHTQRTLASWRTLIETRSWKTW